MKRAGISVLINTRNEEDNLRACLESLGRASQIIVVDMESEDRTVEIAREFTEEIYSHPKLGYADPARAFALSKASCDWVLIVDADEIVTPPLWDELERLAREDLIDVALVPFRTWMFGRRLNGGGWGPGQETHPRFFRRSVNIISDRVHMMFDVPSTARMYPVSAKGAVIEHFNYYDLFHFIEKLNRYTTIEAMNAFDGKKEGFPGFRSALIKAIKEFTRRFIIKKGYRDGGEGFLLAFLMSAYYLSAWQKEGQMRGHGKTEYRSAIKSVYDREKRRVSGMAGADEQVLP
ncbi:MAG: glycosyltransferase family 2 protein [Rectinemataceae bacterium]